MARGSKAIHSGRCGSYHFQNQYCQQLVSNEFGSILSQTSASTTDGRSSSDSEQQGLIVDHSEDVQRWMQAQCRHVLIADDCPWPH